MSVNSTLLYHSIGREFQGLAVRGKKLFKRHLVTSRNGDGKIVQSVKIMSRPTLFSSLIRDWATRVKPIFFPNSRFMPLLFLLTIEIYKKAMKYNKKS